MKYSTAALVTIAAVTLSSCASVPRDAGTRDVNQALALRGTPEVAWRASPAAADDESVRALLADGLTADDAVAIALVNSPRLQIALAELGVARADLIAASTVENPIFEFEIRYPGSPYRPLEFRLAQSLVGLMQLPRRRAIGRDAFESAQMRVSSEVLRFAGDVRSAYYDLLAAVQHVAHARTLFAASQLAADVALRQHAAGNITDLDLENEQAVYEQAKLDLSRAEREALLAREVLIRATGLRDASGDWQLPEAFPELPAEELPQETLEQIATEQRLDMAIARREVDLARRRVPLTRLEVLEETVIDFHFEREPSGERTRGPGIEFPIPIFDTGRAARSRAEAEYLRARHALAALEAEASSQLRSARASLAESRARVEYYRDVVVPRRQRIVELTKLQHNAMLVGIFQLLDAKKNETQALRDYVEAQREYWTARTDLDRALQGVADDTTFVPATTQGAGKRADVGSGGGH
jgi:outer membrane protein, heavy metal efflux system